MSPLEIITTHENTDFDALASMLGAAKLHSQARAVLPHRLNRNLRDFLTLYWDQLPFTRAEELPRGRIQRLILVDTQTLPDWKGIDKDTEILFIDHHPLDRPLEKRMRYHGGEAGSTTTLLAQQIVEAGVSPSPVEATLLMLGIYEDTGSLSYPSTTASDLRGAAWLLDRGANLQVVNEFLHQPLSEEQRRLYRRLLEGIEHFEIHGHPVVIASAQAESYTDEISTLAHILRDLYDPHALFLLVRMDRHIQWVARSTVESIDVGALAKAWGGGGHSKAAAALIESQDLDQAKARLRQLLESSIQPTATVREMMSIGVQTLSPQTTVAEAEELMRRYGHEGFPVVEGGQLVGVLTRGEIDRAVQHGLQRTPIERYMHKGSISVNPSDPLERTQQVMLEHGLGQVPVVEKGQIVGIVTRTDLIKKLWGGSPGTSRNADILVKLERALPPHILAFLQHAGRVAREMGYSLYLVGGFVRDLLLGLPNLDLDLVVEGDAIALAQRLAKELGGRVHGHPPFGTAKLFFEEAEASFTAIDLVTARREFYEHPTALPSVERSSIKQDLHRRDFTINTLAIALDPDRFGDLLDYYGGLADLENRLIRVLHNLSFVEDPTRILRGVRLEQRLGFRLEARSEELIATTAPFLHRVSGERIREELEAIFGEEDPSRVLDRLQGLGVLQHIHSSLSYSQKLGQLLRGLPERWQSWRGMDCRSRTTDVPPPILYLALLVRDVDPPTTQDLARRLSLRAVEARVLRDLSDLHEALGSLSRRRIARSEIYRLLKPFSDQALFLAWLGAGSALVHGRLELYHRELACIELELDGHDLKRLGLPAGPRYREILEALRGARLDGVVKTRQQEETLARRLIVGQ